MAKNNFSLEEIKNMEPAKAIELLTDYIAENQQNDEALTIRGLKYWAMNMRKEAINDYLEAIRINPESKARMALQMTNSILDYYNKDLLNP